MTEDKQIGSGVENRNKQFYKILQDRFEHENPPGVLTFYESIHFHFGQIRIAVTEVNSSPTVPKKFDAITSHLRAMHHAVSDHFCILSSALSGEGAPLLTSWVRMKELQTMIGYNNLQAAYCVQVFRNKFVCHHDVMKVPGVLLERKDISGVHLVPSPWKDWSVFEKDVMALWSTSQLSDDLKSGNMHQDLWTLFYCVHSGENDHLFRLKATTFLIGAEGDASSSITDS